MSIPNILVVGGAGFIGSHVCKTLTNSGFRPIIFDNLSTGNVETVSQYTFIKGDLANPADLDQVFENHKITAVMHFAALTDVGESVNDPIKYYIQNVVCAINLIAAMKRHKIKTLVFSSSAAIFGFPEIVPMPESHTCNPISPYGQTKLMVEKILKDCDNAYGIKSSCLRYFNAAGGDSEGVIKNYKVKENNLIPLVLRSLKDPSKKITIYGTDYDTPDGTCLRDYIHVEDLADAHVMVLKELLEGGQSTNYNLGNGNGFSVNEVIEAAEKVTGLKVNVVKGPRRAGDPPVLVADSKKAREELGWTPNHPGIEEMILHAWKSIN